MIRPPRTRGRLRGYALPLLALATAVTTLTTLVPPAVAGYPVRPVLADQDDLPPTPGPGSLRENPQVLAIAEDANNALRYSLAMVAADPSADFPAGTVEADLQAGLRSLPPERLTPITKAARDLVTGSEATRIEQFGRHGVRTVDEYRRLGFDGAFKDVRFDRDELERALLLRAGQLAEQGRLTEAIAKREAERLHLDFSKLPKLSNLDFRIERVKCVDETNPEWPGDDELLLGGLRIGNTGYTKKVSQFFVGDDFYDGVAKNYTDPGKLFTSFDLSSSDPWPRGFVAVVMLAEQDGSGFADAVQSAWEKVGDKVQQVIAQAVAGVLTPFVGAAIAEAIGQVVAWLVGIFVDWLLGFFQDDVFEARSAYVELPHRYEFMYNDPAHLGWTNHRLPSTSMSFAGFGGSYKVNVHWQVES